MLSSTVRQARSTGVWNTGATVALGPDTSRPAIVTVPVERASVPIRIFNNVVLPQPLGPTSVMNSPGATSKSTSAKAVIASPLRVR